MKAPTTALLTVLLLLPAAHAHHGQEFFLLYDARVQPAGHGILQGNFSFIDEGGDDSLNLSPSLSLGILPRTAFALRADFSDDAGAGWAYRSIEPGFQFDLTPPNLKLPVRFGLAVAYQFADGSSGGHSPSATGLSGETVTHAHGDTPAAATHVHAAESMPHDDAGTAPHDHSTHDHPPLVSTPAGGDNGPDGLTPEEIAAINAANAANAASAVAAPAPAAASSVATPPKPKPKPKSAPKPTPKSPEHHHSEGEAGHSHSGSIHNHDDNLFTARLIFEADLTPGTLFVGNLINVIPEGGESAWGYAVGLRQRLRPGLAVGVEALGDFDRNLHQEVLGAVFWEPRHHVLIKIGAGTGLNANSPDATLRAGILWMF